MEDRVLDRVRILEFIDERRLVPVLNGFDQVLPAGLLQRGGEPGQEVVEELDVLLLFPGGELLFQIAKNLRLEEEEISVHLRGQRGSGFLEFLAEVKERMDRE